MLDVERLRALCVAPRPVLAVPPSERDIRDVLVALDRFLNRRNRKIFEELETKALPLVKESNRVFENSLELTLRIRHMQMVVSKKGSSPLDDAVHMRIAWASKRNIAETAYISVVFNVLWRLSKSKRLFPKDSQLRKLLPTTEDISARMEKLKEEWIKILLETK